MCLFMIGYGAQHINNHLIAMASTLYMIMDTCHPPWVVVGTQHLPHHYGVVGWMPTATYPWLFISITYLFIR